MTITKFGHCCLLIEINGTRILTDPGKFTTEQDTLTGIDIILITHEHADHCHADSLIHILKNNPEALVISNSSVATLLSKLEIDTYILEGRDAATIFDVALQAYDGPHAEIFETIGMVQNTGYLIGDRFFYPGDAYTIPNTAIDILALPVAGPWCKVSEALHYALAIKPRVAIPVHDALLNDIGKAVTYPHFVRELQKQESDFVILELNIPIEF
jgi:L-ascorbate metabolism protein UlaG (beta-lactamase superfamily)